MRPGDPVELLLLGERRPSRGPGEDDRLGDLRGGQLRAEGGRGGLEGAHPRADVVGDPQGVEGVHLLAGRPVDRGVAGVEPDDVDPPVAGVPIDGDDLLVGHPRRVVALGLGRDEGQDAGAHERARVDADPAGRQQPLRLQREEFRVPRTRADEMDDHLVLSFNNPHSCISTTSFLYLPTPGLFSANSPQHALCLESGDMVVNAVFRQIQPSRHLFLGNGRRLGNQVKDVFFSSG